MSREFEIIGAPFGVCAGDEDCKNAPQVLRAIGLSDKITQRTNEYWGADILDGGDVHYSAVSDDNMVNLKNYSQKLSERVAESLDRGKTPVFIGGDHTVSIGLVAGVKRSLEQDNKKIGLLWIDAHADLNCSVGNYHGKSVASLMGLLEDDLMGGTTPLSPENIAFIGVRDLMPGEDQIIKNQGIKFYGMEDIDSCGIDNVVDRAVNSLLENCDHLYLSFDIDVMDGAVFRGTGTPEIGGLNSREAINLISNVLSRDQLTAVDIVEYSPERDENGVTAELILKLLDTAWGFRK